MFEPAKYDQIFLASFAQVDLPDPKYGVVLTPSTVSSGDTYWKVIGIHHLLPAENKGNRNIFITALDENGKRVKPPFYAGWTWKDRQPNQRADPVLLDKPDNEAMGNIPVGSNQVVSVWIKGPSVNDNQQSDVVTNLHTIHADERGPNGEVWNSIGHHSFYVVFQRTMKGTVPQPPIEEPIPPTPIPPVTSDLTSDELKTVRFAIEYNKAPWPFPGSNFLVIIAKMAKMIRIE